MGMYTWMSVTVRLRPDTPLAVTSGIRWLINQNGERTGNWTVVPQPYPDESAFWYNERAHQLCSDYIYRTPKDPQGNDTTSSLTLGEDGVFELRSYTCSKNYKRPQEEFLDMLAPYVDTSQNPKVGQQLYEDYDKPNEIVWDGTGFKFNVPDRSEDY